MIAVGELRKHVGVSKACHGLDVPRASYYRSDKPSSQTKTGPRRSHRRALSTSERTEVKTTLYSERFVDKSPYQVYATLLDEGRYLCSVRTMYRILAEDKASRERRNQLRHPNYVKPELLATGPNQVWSWDITKLLGPQKWTYYYLYVILDIYSRYVVGWILAHREAQDLAVRLIRDGAGRRTLFYAKQGNIFTFGIEQKALSQLNRFERKLKQSSIVKYFSFSFIPERDTMLEDIFELKPNTIVSYHPVKGISEQKFLNLDSLEKHHENDIDYWKETLRKEMKNDVSFILKNTDKVGVFLTRPIGSAHGW